MAEEVPPHVGNLYDHVVSPFFLNWNNVDLYVYMRHNVSCYTHDLQFPQTNEMLRRGIIFGNCNRCFSCGPFLLNCDCGGLYIKIMLVNPENRNQTLYYAHPITVAIKSNKPCDLPYHPGEFGRMYRDYIHAPRPTPEQPFGIRYVCTPEQLSNDIERMRRKRKHYKKTHYMDYMDNPDTNDNTPFAIVHEINPTCIIS
jgi:hypothetical protein